MRYKQRMKTLPVVGVLLLCASSLGLGGCDRFGHGSSSGDAGGPASSAAGSSGGAAAADVPAFAGFEGEIDLVMKGKTSPAPIPVNLMIKGDAVRFDAPGDMLAIPDVERITGGGKVYGILKASDKQLTVVLDTKREAVVIGLDGMGDRVKGMRPHVPGAPDPAPSDPPKVTKTNKKDTVAGLPCQIWDIRNSDKSKIDICVADQGASFFQLPLTGIPTENAWALELMDGKHFPLRAVLTERDGSDGGRIEVTKLDKHALDASLFEIPAGYKQMTLDEMIASLSGGHGAVPPVDPNDVPHKPHGGHHRKH